MSKKAKEKRIVNNTNKPWLDLFLVSTIIASLVIFGKGMNYDILNFDDNEYFSNYPEILKLSFTSIKQYFTSYYVLMYQPLPVLSFALTFKFFKTDPVAHHLVNLLFHVGNIYLVYLFIGKLSDKPLIRKIVTILFALHPLAVEAVIWISCRSSVMYTFFYLLGLLSYIKYRTNGTNKDRNLTYLWFILSLLSKAHAVTFPFAIILIDIFRFKVRVSKQFILNKLPYFALSLAFGIITLLNPETIENITNTNYNYSIIDQVCLVTYELAWYFVKVIVPYNLSPIAVYPPLIDGKLPLLYYLSPLFLILLGYLVYKFMSTKPFILFGILFFYLLLSVALQIIPSRLFIVADRYGYLPNIGLFFILAHLFNEWKEGSINFLKDFKAKENVMYVVMAAYCFVSFTQVSIWENDSTLSDRIIEINPETNYIAKAYGIRGNYKMDKLNDLPDALKDYQKASSLDSNDWIARHKTGLIYKSMGDTASAFKYYKEAVRINPETPVPYTDMGVIFFENKNYDMGMRFADSALKIQSFFPNALNLKGVCYLNLGKPLLAEAYFTKAITVDPNYVEGIKNRAIVRTYDLNNKTGACEDYYRGAMLGDADCQRMMREFCGGL